MQSPFLYLEGKMCRSIVHLVIPYWPGKSVRIDISLSSDDHQGDKAPVCGIKDLIRMRARVCPPFM